MLYIVATPIGNLSDITLRALEVLKSVEGIICEDSRRTSILLNHYQINTNGVKKPFLVLNDFNEAKIVPLLIEKLKQGQNLALVSDAGTPLISDPGYKLVRECILQGIKVDSIPGLSAATLALTLSGLPPDKFLFVGYPPEKAGNRKVWFNNINDVLKILKTTVIMYVSPYKVLKNLEEMMEIFGDIDIVLCQELTKIHQKVQKGKISYFIDLFHKNNPKGEITILF